MGMDLRSLMQIDLIFLVFVRPFIVYTNQLLLCGQNLEKKMYKTMLSLAMVLLLSSCSLFQPRQQVIEQGNIITPEQTQKLHTGMSEADVKAIMGSPLVVNIFTPGRIDYVYTYGKGNSRFIEKRVTCTFVNNRLRNLYVS